jgi:hypothetical protein
MPLGGRLLRRVRIEQERVRVPQHDACPGAAKEVEALGGLRPALGHVAERHDRVDVAAGDVVERRTQPDGVAMRVGDQRDAQPA